MSVIAKFFVSKKSEYAGGSGQVEVHLAPVTRGEENKTWSKYTPSGEMRLMILNPVASEQFVVGEEYLITFEHAPKPDVEGPALGHPIQP